MHDYFFYRRKGWSIRRSLELSGVYLGPFFLRLLVVLFFFLIVYGAAQYLEDSFNERVDETRRYSKELERVLAVCLHSSSGQPVRIGDEIYLCGATPTGVKL